MDAERKPPPSSSSSSSQGQQRPRPRRRPRPRTSRSPTVFAIDDIHVTAPPEDPTTTTTTTLLSAAAHNSNTNVGGNQLRRQQQQQQQQQQVPIQPISTTNDVRLLSQLQLQSNISTDGRNFPDMDCNDDERDLDIDLNNKSSRGGGPKTAATFDEIIASRRRQQQEKQLLLSNNEMESFRDNNNDIYKQQQEQQSQQRSNRHHSSNASLGVTTTRNAVSAASSYASLPTSTIRKSSLSSSSLKDDGKGSDNNKRISSSSSSSNDDKESMKNQLDESIKNRLEEVEVMRELRNQIERDEQNQQELPPAVSSDDDDDDMEQDHIEMASATHNNENNDIEEEKEDSDQEGDGIEQHVLKKEVAIIHKNSDINQKGDDDDEDDDDEQDFDDIATISEERYVMRRLLQNVQASEDVEYFAEMYPSLMTDNTAIATTAITGEGLEESHWNNTRIPQQRQKHLRLPWGITSIKNTTTAIAGSGGDDVNDETTQSNVTEIIEIQRRRIRQTIPKWIPQESGEYICNETHDLLFTRSQFMLNVVVEVEKQIDGLRNDQTWKVTLSSSNSENDDPSDDDSYILEAEGKPEALNLLREKTQSFVRLGIERVNLKRLVEDDESLVVDVSLDIAKESIDSRFSTLHVGNLGAYIKAIYPSGILARDLGSKGAYEMGCAVIAVNGKEIANPTELEEIVSLAKMRCGDRSRSSSILKFTLCLSKYADLSDAPHFSELNIRRRDGRPYKTEVYENYKLYRAIELSPQPQKSRNSKPGDDVDEEEEEKDADHPKVPVKMKRKRKDQRAQKSDDRKPKRKKIICKEVESNSDGDIDNDNFDVVDDKATEEIDETTVKNGETEKVQRKANDGIKRFWNFEKKFKPLIDLDYKDTKINIKKSCSSIFSAHKSLFGENAICGDDCVCFLRLPELDVNVIKEHIAQQKKKGKNVETEQELEGRTRGIFQYFAPRFFPLLKKEYPGETQDQLINRLVDMWPTHTANRMYGVRCIEGCACEGEWDQIFGRGDKAKAKAFTASMKKRSKKRPTSQIDQEKQSKTTTSGPVIPRKKKKAPAAASHVLPSIQSERGEKRNTPSSENAHNTNGNKKPKRLSTMITNMSILSREPFEVAFETSTELGGYFRTEFLPNGGSRCRVYSKYATGQLAKDLRITNGTAVVSVITGNTVHKISNHTDLKQFYDNAKRSRKTLCLLLKNQGVSAASTHNNVDTDSWDKFGIWVGINDGWAGGGASKADQYSPTTPRFTKTTESNTFVSAGKNKSRSTSQKSIHDLDLPEWTTTISTAEPGHTKRPPNKPLIRANQTKRKRSKKVVFAMPKNEEFFFLKDEASNVRRVEITIETQAHQMSPQLSTEEMLIDAIRNKSCKDVIEALENGAIRDLKSYESVLKVQYDFVGNELKRIGKLAGGANATKEKNDLSATYRVLSIYLNAIHLIEKTMSLKKWYAIGIELRHIDLERTQNTIDMIGGMVAIKLRNAKDKKEDLVSLLFLFVRS
jgi:hypothetical protein